MSAHGHAERLNVWACFTFVVLASAAAALGDDDSSASASPSPSESGPSKVTIVAPSPTQQQELQENNNAWRDLSWSCATQRHDEQGVRAACTAGGGGGVSFVLDPTSTLRQSPALTLNENDKATHQLVLTLAFPEKDEPWWDDGGGGTATSSPPDSQELANQPLWGVRFERAPEDGAWWYASTDASSRILHPKSPMCKPNDDGKGKEWFTCRIPLLATEANVDDGNSAESSRRGGALPGSPSKLDRFDRISLVDLAGYPYNRIKLHDASIMPIDESGQMSAVQSAVEAHVDAEILMTETGQPLSVASSHYNPFNNQKSNGDVVPLYTDAPADGVDVLAASWGGMFETVHVVRGEGDSVTPKIVLHAEVYMPHGALALSTANASMQDSGAWGDRDGVEFYLKLDASDISREKFDRDGLSGAWQTLGRIDVIAEALDGHGRVLASSQPLRLLSAAKKGAPKTQVSANGVVWQTVLGDDDAKSAAERGDWIRFVVPMSSFVPVQKATPDAVKAKSASSTTKTTPWNVLQLRVRPRVDASGDDARLLPSLPGTTPMYSPKHFVSFFVDGVNLLRNASSVLEYGTMTPVVPMLEDARTPSEKATIIIDDGDSYFDEDGAFVG
eukprot:CAMPEP_0119191974 /NCGR_PEP_ID=MMETSP1316-20130426/2603_1 /TAXON_ID=41880 /ORGANISM="Pycnococcus provasolii, Strain RCC2336" /LENGTH=616 /DNA_ID=CAMNT_0007187077 /DNA_START=153 /DNA_END=2003 /DNA_ORIENTATION=+